MNKYRERVIRLYEKFYPNLTKEEILSEIEVFEEVMIVNGPMSETSSNETKYLRGWLSKANHANGEKK